MFNKKITKILRLLVVVFSLFLIFSLKAFAATPYEITKSGGADIRVSYSKHATSVRKAPKGSIIWVSSSIKNSSGNLWYKLTDGNWIFSDNVKKHSCSWTHTGTTSPTCTKGGAYYYRCNKCGATKSSGISAKGHNYKSNVCTRCGVWNKNSLKSKTNMNNVRYYITTNGSKVHSGPYGACSTVAYLNKGNEIYVTEKIVNASNNVWYKYSGGYIFSDYVKPHSSCSYTTGIITKKATCTASGTKTKTCTVCGKIKTETIAKKSHTYKSNVCTYCGYWKASGLKSKTSLNSVKYYVTTNGAKVHSGPYGATKTIATLNRGNEIYVTEKIVNASNNVWYKYSGGYIFADYVTKHSSCSWNSGKVTKTATCKQTGTKVYTCTLCSKTKSVSITKTGHKYEGNVCKYCGTWNQKSLKSKTKVNLTFVVNSNGAKVHSGPYGATKTVKTLSKGTKITVTEKIVNASKNVWYKTSGGYIFSDYVKKYAPPKASIKLSCEKATVYVGNTKNLTATVKGESKKVTWKSSNTSVATVSSSGKITPKKVGSCTITAKANGKTAKCKITVKQIATPKNITFKTLASGRAFKISHKAVEGASGYELTYKSTVETKKITYSKTTANVTIKNGAQCDFKCTVRAYKIINGKKIYSKASAIYAVHAHNSLSTTVKTFYTKASPANYTYHITTIKTTFNCIGCKKKITSQKSNNNSAKHTFVSGVCSICGEKKAANYVIGKLYPEVGKGPSYSSSENKNGKNPIYMAAKYSDSFFTKNSYNFSPDLSKLSAIGASASYDKTFAKQFLEGCKFKSIKNISKTSTAKKGNNDNARITIGHKKVNGTTVVAVLVNGYNTGAYEWVSNFNVGKSGLHKGFSTAATEMTTAINNYIKEKGINTKKVKIWITGHSRGGAVTGMIAANMNNKYGAKNVYAYGFATPNGVPTTIADKQTDNNIFNIVNPGDFVPYVVPTKWGFTKFGTTYNISLNSTAKNIYKTMSGDTYNGLTVSERKSLIKAFCEYSPSRNAYYTKKKYATPCDFGRALGLFLSDGSKTEALNLVKNCCLDDGDAIKVLAEMLYDGILTTKINEAHTMETYVAMLYSKYP